MWEKQISSKNLTSILREVSVENELPEQYTEIFKTEEEVRPLIDYVEGIVAFHDMLGCSGLREIQRGMVALLHFSPEGDIKI